ncbi:MAG: DUF763 domain-containing protein [Candidatus Paceibacterota bacterium]
MQQRGMATFGLDYGKCPAWLFQRMVKLSREMIRIIIEEAGPDEFLKKMADPVWFQSLGTVLAFDWNSSGLTTILTAALKEAMKGQEKELGVFICGGKGKTSRKTPEEILNWGNRLSFPEQTTNSLISNSKITAKVDNSLIQDGYQIYHHSFLFSKNGSWAVIQQGMNLKNQTARRYHWYSDSLNFHSPSGSKEIDCEPHSGIISEKINSSLNTLNLTSRESQNNKKVSLELVNAGFKNLMKDITILASRSSQLSRMVKFKIDSGQLTLLALENKEFSFHPVVLENFFRHPYLKKIMYRLTEEKPKNYKNLIATSGVGPKTIRALALIAEVIYGAKPSYQDPARYSFAHGGKDATPYPVDRKTYDKSIALLQLAAKKSRLSLKEKERMIYKISNLYQT